MPYSSNQILSVEEIQAQAKYALEHGITCVVPLSNGMGYPMRRNTYRGPEPYKKDPVIITKAHKIQDELDHLCKRVSVLKPQEYNDIADMIADYARQ